jgi:hypothetical protein
MSFKIENIEKRRHKLVCLRERSERNRPRAPEAKQTSCSRSETRVRERSERKGPRAPEAELGKRNSGSGTREAELGGHITSKTASLKY